MKIKPAWGLCRVELSLCLACHIKKLARGLCRVELSLCLACLIIAMKSIKSMMEKKKNLLMRIKASVGLFRVTCCPAGLSPHPEACKGALQG